MMAVSRRRFLAGALAGAARSRVSGDEPQVRIRVGQIGTSHSHAEGKMISLRSLPGRFEIAGIVEADDARRNQVREAPAFDGLRWLTEAELLAQPDVRVVVVETGLDDLTATALRCLRAGKHVHLDKPGSADHDAFAAMRTDAEARGLIVQMGYMLRHHPAFELLFRAARDGWLGDITGIDASMGKQADPDLRRTIGALPGGGMYELACHLIDAVVTLMGPPRRVTAFSTPTRDDGVKDNQLAVMEYPRATAVIRCHHADPFGTPHRRFSVTGTKGTLTIEPLESGRATLSLTEPRGGYSMGTQTVEFPNVGGRYDGSVIALATAIHTGVPLPWSATHDIAVHATVLEAAGMKPR